MTTKRIAIGLIFMPLFFGCLTGCDSDSSVQSTATGMTNPESLQQTWFISYEEDNTPNDSTSIYRPDSFDFPRSRGRTGFTLFENKSSGFRFIVNHEIAPADGLQHSLGYWELISDNEIRFYYPDRCNPNSNQYTVVISEILDLSDDILRLKLISREER